MSDKALGRIHPAIFLSHGITLVSEDDLAAHFAHVMTREQFSVWRKRLKVPGVIFGRSTVYVDKHTFDLALKAITRIGEPDFLTPANTEANKVPRGYSVYLDLERVKESKEELVDHMYWALHADQHGKTKKEETAIESAAKRFQEQYDMIVREEERRAQKKGARLKRLSAEEVLGAPEEE